MWTATILKRVAVWSVLPLLLSFLVTQPVFAGPLKEVTLSVEGWA
ncbi:MAG: hypothetical protein ACE5G5_04765 [Candidatus Methylomirabilales bacterium]